jgi:LacI family transcriptional regulator
MKRSEKPKIHAREGLFYVFCARHRLGDEGAAGALAAAAELNCPWMVSCVPDVHLSYAEDQDLLGAICATWNTSILNPMLKMPFPVINCSNSQGPIAGLGNFISDDREVGRLAARHLIAKGFRNFMLISHAEGVTHEERGRGFQEELRKRKFPLQVFRHDFRPTSEESNTHAGYLDAMISIFHEPFQKLPLGTGVFSTSDSVAIYFLRVMAMSYPEHLDTTGVLGVDNELGRQTHLGVLPALSSIEPGFFAMGHAAMTWLLEHPGPEAKAQCARLLRRFPPRGVIERASTACGGCAEPLTARMIRWAWNRIQRGGPVTVTEMASEHRMSLKTLERKFSEHAGATADETLRGLRLDLAKSLLRDTRLTVAEISEHCGYAKQDVLSRALRAAEGCSPRDFRKRFAAFPQFTREALEGGA